MKDVVLSHFSKIDGMLAANPIQAGDDLIIDQANPNRLLDRKGQTITLLSENMKEKLKELTAKGYRLTAAKAAHVVFWYDKEKNEKYRVVLPILFLDKGGTRQNGE